MADIDEKPERSGLLQFDPCRFKTSERENKSESKSKIIPGNTITDHSLVTKNNNSNDVNYINLDEWGNQLAGSRNTKRVTASSVKLFRQFLKETRGGRLDFENFEEETLIDLFIRFFKTIRKPDGNTYTKNGLLSIRFGLRRHLLDLHKDDLTKHPRLNSVFTDLMNKLKREGKGEINHYPPISQEDMVKIYTSGVFSIDNPKGLLRKVFFETEMFFYRRGREDLRDLKGKHFKIGVDALSGKRYLAADSNLECGRWSRGEAAISNNIEPQNCLIREIGTAVCPVKSFAKYMSKRHPGCDAFFQRPYDTVPFSETDPWYHSAWGLGLNKMTNMMKEISLDAGLSKIYTNHSIRATSRSVFDVIWSKDFSIENKGPTENNGRCSDKEDEKNEQTEELKTKNNSYMKQKIIKNKKSQENLHMKEANKTRSCQDASTSQNYLNPSSSSPSINSYNLNAQNSTIDTKPITVNHADIKKQQLEFLEAQMHQADVEAKKRQAEAKKRQAELAEAKKLAEKLAEEERLRKEAENKVYKYMVLNHEKKVLETLRALWKGNQFCDATLQNEFISIPVHKIVLIACCPKILETYDYIMKDTNVQVCFPRKVTAEALKAFVDYLYNGSLNLSRAILESMEYLSGMLGLDEIRQLCNQFRSDMLNDSFGIPDKTIVHVNNPHEHSSHQMSYNDHIVPPPPIVRPSTHGVAAPTAVSIQLSNFQDATPVTSVHSNNFNLFSEPHADSVLTEVSHIKLEPEPEVDLTAEDCTEIKQESLQSQLYEDANCKFEEWPSTVVEPHHPPPPPPPPPPSSSSSLSQPNFVQRNKNNFEMSTVDLSLAPLNAFQKQTSNNISRNISSGVITISPSNSPCPSPGLAESPSDIQTLQISNTHTISTTSTNPFPVSLISTNGQSISLTDQDNKRKHFADFDSKDDRKRSKIILN